MTPSENPGEQWAARGGQSVGVVGASGFVGRAVCQALRRRGATVVEVPAPRLTLPAGEDPCSAVLLHELDSQTLAAAFSGCAVVVNAAGMPDASSREVAQLMGANAVLPGVVARACSLAGVHRLVHVSSAVVQGTRPTLDESDEVQPFSPYSQSKAAGEVVVKAFDPGALATYRPPSVHAADRRITRALVKIARSPLASVAGPAHRQRPSPQALLENVADALAFLATSSDLTGNVIHPWEGLTTRTLLESFGARRVLVLPDVAARGVLGLARLSSRVFAPLEAHARRLDMLWFGQAQAQSSLTGAGWSPPVGRPGWTALGLRVGAGG